jgi:hypothetical protein
VDRVVCPEVDLFVLDCSPDSFHEDIVAPAALSDMLMAISFFLAAL